jgi:hypothetical protein
MTDAEGYAYPFLGTGCDHRSRSFREFKDHVTQYPKSVKSYQKIRGTFWGPIIRFYCEKECWPIIGSIFRDRIPEMPRRIKRLDTEKAENYWKKGKEEMEEIFEMNWEQEEEEEKRRSEEGRRRTKKIHAIDMTTSVTITSRRKSSCALGRSTSIPV